MNYWAEIQNCKENTIHKNGSLYWIPNQAKKQWDIPAHGSKLCTGNLVSFQAPAELQEEKSALA